MSIAGNSSQWAPLFPDGLMSDIITLILDGWSTFPKPRRHEHEDPITAKLREHLCPAKIQRRLPVTIWLQSLETDRTTGRQIGRLDIRFLHGYRERVYLAFECKRLNVTYPSGKRASLASEYVEEGMMRFVTEQYAGGLDKGGMLGYIMDGNMTRATRAVRNAIDKRRASLHMKKGESLSCSSLFPKDNRVKETEHRVRRKGFDIHHVFLAV